MGHWDHFLFSLPTVIVWLPQGQIQEIKRMMLVDFTHAHKNLIIFKDHSLQQHSYLAQPLALQ
jgi:hypothetical protein